MEVKNTFFWPLSSEWGPMDMFDAFTASIPNIHSVDAPLLVLIYTL